MRKEDKRTALQRMTITLREDDLRRLKALAAKENRPVSIQAVVMLRDALKRRKAD